MYERLLVPTDGTPTSERAAQHAYLVADRFDARVHVLAVVESGAEAPGLSSGEPEGFRTQAQHAIDRVVDLGGGRDTDPVTAFRVGDPATEILAYAADAAIDLVVMGTHGRSGLDRYLDGSVAETVVRNASVPVLVVGREADAVDREEVADEAV